MVLPLRQCFRVVVLVQRFHNGLLARCELRFSSGGLRCRGGNQCCRHRSRLRCHVGCISLHFRLPTGILFATLSLPLTLKLLPLRHRGSRVALGGLPVAFAKELVVGRALLTHVSRFQAPVFLAKQLLLVTIENIVGPCQERQAIGILASIVNVVEDAEQAGHLILLANQIAPAFACLENNLQPFASCRNIDQQDALLFQVMLLTDAFKQLSRIAHMVGINHPQTVQIGIAHLPPAATTALVILLRARAHGKVSCLEAGARQRAFKLACLVLVCSVASLGKSLVLTTQFVYDGSSQPEALLPLPAAHLQHLQIGFQLISYFKHLSICLRVSQISS